MSCTIKKGKVNSSYLLLTLTNSRPQPSVQSARVDGIDTLITSTHSQPLVSASRSPWARNVLTPRASRQIFAHPTQRRSPRATPSPGVTTLGRLPFILDGSKASSQFQRECDDEARLIVARLRASPPAWQAVLLVLRECSYSVLLTGEDGGSVSSLASCRVVS